MTLPSVSQVYHLALPTGTQLLSEETDLTHAVSWARRMSVHPPAFGALEEREVALLSVGAISLLDERLTLMQVVEALAERDAAALAVTGEVSEDARLAATACRMPLFLLPADADLRDVERDVIRLIVEREAQLERRGQQLYRKLARLSIENQGLQAISETLLRITGNPVAILDEQLSVQAAAWPDEYPVTPQELTASLSDETALRQWFLGLQLDGTVPPHTELGLTPLEWGCCIAVIVIEGELVGYVSLLGPIGGFNDLDVLALERGALVCAVELAKRRAVEAAEDKLRGSFLDLILTAGQAEEGALSRRAEEMGYDLNCHHVVVVFGLDEHSSQALAVLVREFRARLLNSGVEVFLGPYEDDLVALCCAESSVPLRQLEGLAYDAREQVAHRSLGVRVTAGIGRSGAGLLGLRRSFNQAREALKLAHQLFGGDRVLSFNEMGLYRLLCQLQGGEELGDFYERTLAPLVHYDAARGGEFVRTLEAFFIHRGNVSQTAEYLFLHRNSLLYRLERIGEITGMDLDDADDRFSLQLALKIHPLLDGSSG